MTKQMKPSIQINKNLFGFGLEKNYRLSRAAFLYFFDTKSETQANEFNKVTRGKAKCDITLLRA